MIAGWRQRRLKTLWCQARRTVSNMVSFAKRLQIILENQPISRRRPAIILHKSGREIRVDHARWMVGRTGTKFLAAGIGPGGHEYKIQQIYRYGPLTSARDFFAKPRYEINTKPAHHEFTEDDIEDLPICDTCRQPAEDCACRKGPHIGLVKSGRRHKSYLVRRPRFRKILTIKQENVNDVKWL